MTKKKREQLAIPEAMAGRLTIARLHVHQTLGIEDVTLDLGPITVIEGKNAAGKSSLLKALRSCLGVDRTSLARLARIGDDGEVADAPFAEVVLVSDDGEREVHVSRKAGGSPEVRERTGQDWRTVARPVEWLRTILDPEAASPALWLAADDETRATAVLAAMPLAGYRREDALRAAGLEAFRLPPIPAGLHPLEDLEQVEAAVFSSRTEVNRQERAEADAAAKLLAGLPAEVPKDVAAVVAQGEAAASRLADEVAREAEAIEAAAHLAQERVAAEFRASVARLRADHGAEVAAIRAEAERQIAERLAATEEAIAAVKAAGEREIDAADVKREAATQALEAKRRDLAAGREKLAALREAQRAADTDRHVRATAEEAKAKAREHAARAAALTAGIDAIRRYRLELAGRLPIKGLAVKFSETGKKSLTLDGVPLSQVNQGRLVELATEVSLLRSRPATDGRPYLPIILLDGIEDLDSGARAALLREVAARGAQVVAACVSDGPLRVLRGEAALSEAVA